MREIGSEFDFDSNNHFLSANSASFFSGAEFYRSGRDALKAIAINFKGLYKRILLPSLCCESMATPFQDNGYEIEYYKLNSDLTANVEDVLSKLQSTNLFLYMNYFGFQSFSDEVLQFIKQDFNEVIMIEDRTHDILSSRHNSFTPNFTVYSIRKWIAIPDGGVLYSKNSKVNVRVENDVYFSDVRKKALINKSEYLQSGNFKLKELFRQQLVDANTYLDNDKAVISMSEESFEILRNINFEKISEIRRRNTGLLHQALISLNDVKQLKEIDIGRVGLYYPVIFKDRDRIQKELANNMIFCPVIWPLPQEAKEICEVADYISAHMLALPCDQRYDISDMEYIISTLKSILRIR